MTASKYLNSLSKTSISLMFSNSYKMHNKILLSESLNSVSFSPPLHNKSTKILSLSITFFKNRFNRNLVPQSELNWWEN